MNVLGVFVSGVRVLQGRGLVPFGDLTPAPLLKEREKRQT